MIMTRLTIMFICLIATSLTLAGISDAKIDPKSVVAMWLLDDVKGDSAKDASKNGHDGKIQGAELVDGKISKALTFDGKDDLVDCGMEEHDFGDTFSVVLWLEHIGGDYRAVINNGYTDAAFDIRFGREDAGTRLYAMSCALDSSKHQLIEALVSTRHTKMRTTKMADRFLVQMLVPPNEWHHIALVYDGKTVNYYLDGSSEASGDLTGEIKQVPDPVIMGTNARPEWYSGLLDEVAILNVALNGNFAYNIKYALLKGLSQLLSFCTF